MSMIEVKHEGYVVRWWTDGLQALMRQNDLKSRCFWYRQGDRMWFEVEDERRRLKYVEVEPCP